MKIVLIFVLCCVFIFISGCLEGGNLSITKVTSEQTVNEVAMAFSRREAVTDLAWLREFQTRLTGTMQSASLKVVPEIHHYLAWSYLWESWLLQYRKDQNDALKKNLELARKSFERALKDSMLSERYLLGGLIHTMLCRFDEKNAYEHAFYAESYLDLALNLPEDGSIRNFNFGEHYFDTCEIIMFKAHSQLYTGHLSGCFGYFDRYDHYSKRPEYLITQGIYFLFTGHPERAYDILQIFKSPKYTGYYRRREALFLLSLAAQGKSISEQSDIDCRTVMDQLSTSSDFYSSRNLISFSADIFCEPEKKFLSALVADNTGYEVLDDLLDTVSWPNQFLVKDLKYLPQMYRETLFLKSVDDKIAAKQMMEHFPLDYYTRLSAVESWKYDSPEVCFSWFFKTDEKDENCCELLFSGLDNGQLPSEVLFQSGENDYWLERNSENGIWHSGKLKFPETGTISSITMQYRDKKPVIVEIPFGKPVKIQY